VNKNLDEVVDRWVDEVLKSNLEPFSEEIGENWKWVDCEYTERKLGIRRVF